MLGLVEGPKNMVMTFRVSELQTLLGYAGRNKTGRKNELQSRAVELLRLKSTPIQMKIRELYKTAQQGVVQGQQLVEGGGPSSVAVLSQQQSSYLQKNSMIGHPPASTYSNEYQTQQGKAMMYPGYYHDKMHTQTLMDPLGSAMRGTMPNNLPVHPDVQFKRLPFYDHISELLKPSTLMPVGTARIQEQTFVFHLTPAQANEIAFNRDVTKSEYIVQDDSCTVVEPPSLTNRAVKGNKKRKHSLFENGTVEVQMRFCLLETSCEQDDFFPPGIIVKVNEKPCPLPNPIPTNRQGVEPKRPPRPVNISNLVRISPTVANTIYVSWAAEIGRGYVITLNLVKKLMSTQLLHRLKTRGVRHADYTTGLIKEKLREDADSEIATTSLRVSLMCPLGKTRMSLPCRPTTCTHLQCFDANLYLQMNERKPTWICPVCDKPGVFDKLVIDGYFQEVLSSNKLPPDTNEIQLHQDGTWSISVTKKEEKSESPSPPSGKHRGGPPVVAATLEIADDEVLSEDDGEEKSKEKVKGTEAAKKTPLVTTVDLTLSDDNDDDDVIPTGPVVTTSKPESNKSSAHGRNTSIKTSAAATPGYISPNIITLDSPSPPSSPAPLATTLPSTMCSASLPPFFDTNNGSSAEYQF